MKYNFGISACVCVTTFFLYFNDVYAVTCPVRTTWYAAGTDEHKNGYYLVRKPDASTATSTALCKYTNAIPETACAAGYYVYGDSLCKPCPEGMTSAVKNTIDGTADGDRGIVIAGTTGVSRCYWPVADEYAYSNSTGEYHYESACYCDQSCEDGCNPDSSSC